MTTTFDQAVSGDVGTVLWEMTATMSWQVGRARALALPRLHNDDDWLC